MFMMVRVGFSKILKLSISSASIQRDNNVRNLLSTNCSLHEYSCKLSQPLLSSINVVKLQLVFYLIQMHGMRWLTIKLSNYGDCNCCYRLGLAYAGSNRDDVITHLTPVFSDPRASIEVSCSLRLLNLQILR